MTIRTANLANYEAIYIDGQLFVQLPAGIYRVNKEYEFSVGYSGQLVPVEKGSIVESVERGRNVLQHYEHEGGDILSLSECTNWYETQIKPYEDEDGDLEFDDLDTEYSVRKELEKIKEYKPVYQKQPDTYTLVECTVVGDVVDSGSKFIENALAFGGLKFTNSKLWLVDLTGIVSDEFWKFVEKHGLHKDVQNDFKRSYVEFAKHKGNFLFASKCDIQGVKQNEKRYETTLEDAQELERSTREAVKRHLKLMVFGDETINSASKKVVYDDLCNLLSELCSVESKQKTQNTLNRAIRKVRAIQEKLKD